MKYPSNIENNLKNLREIGYIKEVFKDATIENFEFLITKLLKKGGWKFVKEDGWGAIWQKDFINGYRSTIHAIIGYKRTHLDVAWQYGIQWLEAVASPRSSSRKAATTSLRQVRALPRRVGTID